MNGKTHICSHDGRKFTSAQALRNHQAAVHCVPAVANSKTRGRQRRSRRGNRNGGSLSSDIAPTRVPVPPGQNITVTGVDEIGNLDVKQGGSLIHSFNITPGLANRLSNLAKSYQRMTWLNVKFVVSPLVSTVTNGGYVAGIVLDPDDQHVTARDLRSTQGSQTKKWYQDAVVRMPRKTDKLYTSSGDEARFSSPGSFWICSKGAPSADLSITVTMEWTVMFENPTSEEDGSLSIIMDGQLSSVGGKSYMAYFPPCKTTGVEDVSPIIPPSLLLLPGKHFFRVPTYTVEYSEGTGDTGTIQMHFIVYDTSDKHMHFSEDGKTLNAAVWQAGVDNQVLIPSGTFCKYVGQGNVCRVVSNHPSSRFHSSQNSSPTYNNLLRKVRMLEQSLQRYEMNSARDSMTSSPELILNPGNLGL
nr:MAG: putative capsid protein [Inari permutotetravirus]UYL94327.1 MAG: putative capsid protein [Inari permutotetravirus]UYL94329.1 MAG: putative capsid protein [Inari permutotetravirus]